MSVIESLVSTSSKEFAQNREAMLAGLEEVRAIERKQLETEAAFAEKARARGKLLPRERLARLLDPGSPFLELCSIAGYAMYDDDEGRFSGGSLICGIGRISGRRCMIIVWNYAIKGGTITAVNVRKMRRIQDIVKNTRLPLVSLHESGGGNLDPAAAMMDPWLSALFVEGGQVYCNQAQLSAMGIPQITVAHGNATAGGAYQVALSDYIVLVRGGTQLFLAGPPLLEAGTGEKASAEELGGADMHATVSGTGEYLAEDDADGVRIARQIVAQLPADPEIERVPERPPVYPTEELIGLFPADRRKPLRMQEIIARITDGSELFEMSPMIDSAMVCGHAQIGGKRCGIVTTNGPITPAGALKAAQFIQLCDQAFTPLVFLHNTTGFLIGTEVEHAGQVKHSAKLIQAVANTRGPKIAILVGNSYGAGAYAMANRALKPDLLFAWPSARQGLMGGAQAAKVMQIVAEAKWARKGIEVDEKKRAKLARKSQMIEMGLDISSQAIFCSARMMDDGIIDPRDTRRVLSLALDVVLEARQRRLQTTSFGVARL